VLTAPARAAADIGALAEQLDLALTRIGGIEERGDSLVRDENARHCELAGGISIISCEQIDAQSAIAQVSVFASRALHRFRALARRQSRRARSDARRASARRIVAGLYR
jgi:hypothetical protein